MQTRLLDVFDAEYPIMNAGMAVVALGDLAGAVGTAGGIGVIGGSGPELHDLGAETDRAHELAPDAPLVVDILLPLRAPEDADGMVEPESISGPIQTLEDELIEQGAEFPDGYDPSASETELTQAEARERLEIVIEKDVDALATAVGCPDWAVEAAHDAGMPVIALCDTPRHAAYAVESGADILIADGTEGGGHSGPIATHTLVTLLKRQTDLPVVDAGGITTGAHVAGALAAGDDGVWMGTRFIPTQESAADDAFKDEILAAEGDATVRSELVDGLNLRVLKNRFTEVWGATKPRSATFRNSSILPADQRRSRGVGGN